VAQVVEHLSSKHEILSSNPSIEKKKWGLGMWFRWESNPQCVWGGVKREKERNIVSTMKKNITEQLRWLGIPYTTSHRNLAGSASDGKNTELGLILYGNSCLLNTDAKCDPRTNRGMHSTKLLSCSNFFPVSLRTLCATSYCTSLGLVLLRSSRFNRAERK
jgi:hypothetical protein